jgi:myo-inositol-1(or 4)-monophosphatase
MPASARDPADLGDLADLAARLATGAAARVNDLAGHRRDVRTKTTSADLVTVVDQAVERWLVDQLSAARPDDEVLGEEGGRRPGSSGVRWLLDPIDGTVNFVLGLPQYAVSVAAEVDGAVVAAAVCNPASAELFRAAAGRGSYLGDERLRGPRGVPLDRAVIGTGFSYDAARRGRQAGVVASLLPQVADIRRLGAASLDLCAVAAGRLDGYFEAGLHPWDYAAGLLIAAEAGCPSTGPGGGAPSEQLVAVAGPSLAAALFVQLDRLGASAVG